MVSKPSTSKPGSSSTKRAHLGTTNMCQIATTSPGSPSLFKAIDGHVSFSEPGSGGSETSDQLQVVFQVKIPNHSVSLNFIPHEFLDRGSGEAFTRFKQIKKKAIDKADFKEGDLHQLLLPFMEQFRKEVPRDDIRNNNDLLTLKDTEFRGFLELKCTYTKEKPELESIDLMPRSRSFKLPPNLANGSVFSIFNYRDVLIPRNKVPHANNRHFPSSFQPQKVKVNDLPYFYHPLTTSIESMKREIDQHVQIISAGLSCESLRILPLCGIVLDDNNEVVGLLKGWKSIYDEDFIEHVLSENELDSDDYRSWVAQFDIVIDNIRKTGLKLEPKVWNVAINKRGEVWIVYLEDGRARLDGLGLYHWRWKGRPGMFDFLDSICTADSVAGARSDSEDSNSDSDTDSG